MCPCRGHETYVNSLDVRVIGVAGGSMVRVHDRNIVDVGPRSAHIAGLPMRRSPIRHVSSIPPSSCFARARTLAEKLGCSVEDAARKILTRAPDKVIPVVQDLIGEYALDRDQAVLVGEGGGAGALMPFAAQRLNLPHQISRDAEVISSIGVALALVRDVIERLIFGQTSL
jgi:N-methylhydantoinase A